MTQTPEAKALYALKAYFEERNDEFNLSQVSILEAALSQQAGGDDAALLRTIDQRDQAEEALSQAYYLVTGNSPEWSNLFGYDQALEDIDDAQTVLRMKIRNLEAAHPSPKTDAGVVEMVARAICRAGICGPRAHLDEQEETHWRKYEIEAKAAIAALQSAPVSEGDKRD